MTLDFIRKNGDKGLRPDELRYLFVELLKYTDSLERRIQKLENPLAVFDDPETEEDIYHILINNRWKEL